MTIDTGAAYTLEELEAKLDAVIEGEDEFGYPDTVAEDYLRTLIARAKAPANATVDALGHVVA